MIKLLIILFLLSSNSWGASLTAHIGCLGSLGVEHACAGDTITCVNTVESSLPLRLTSLQVSYAGVVTNEPFEEILHEDTTFIVPTGVESVGPNANMAAIYVIKTNILDTGTFRVGAIITGDVSFDNMITWRGWGASYGGIPIQIDDCSQPAPIIQQFSRKHRSRP